ncbi:MAG: DUF6048 family protein, partial [Winogradskyella sp.]
MYASYIKSALILLLFSTIALAQEKEDKAKDTLVYKQKYGLRIGADLSKLARTFLDDDYTGFELMGDYRLTKKMYLAGEIGNEERTLNNEVLSNTTKGSYFKAGIDINLFKNWLEMENLIYVGFRVGASTFSQTRNNYNLYNVNNQYWDEQIIINESEEFSGLAAIWGEVQIGFKAEVFTNLFAGLNVQLKFLGSDTELDDYENLYIPGFNRTYDSSRFGAGFGFNIAYLV